ncbi:hypothetical protein E4U41_002026 [Claviceps citrina]|nr:hypothetical protein E4U41_002026 [Claviceps citrina]
MRFNAVVLFVAAASAAAVSNENQPMNVVQEAREAERAKEAQNMAQQVDKCFWSGTAPFCAGGCETGYKDSGTSSCGDGACCVTGYKKYCCLI